MTVDLDEDAIAACADLVGRMGAKQFQIGHVHENVPIAEAGWFAHAQFRGARITADDHVGPVEAADALCERMLTGAQCLVCRSLVALRDDGAIVYEKQTLLDGRQWNAEDARRAGTCRWRRVGPRWVRGCEPAGIELDIEQALRDGDLDRVPNLIIKLALQDRERARRAFDEIERGFDSGLKMGRQQRRNVERHVGRERDGRR
jgi:hypothetical protein